MKLGNFFAAAPYAEPVNPEPVTYTCIARGDSGILPGGARNPTGNKPMKARVTSGFIFIGGKETLQARLDARAHLDSLTTENGVRVRAYDSDDINHEYAYQILFRVLREWNLEAKDLEPGAPAQFDEIDLLREIIEPEEATRVLRLYNAYKRREHPEVPPEGDFRGDGDGGSDVAEQPPGGRRPTAGVGANPNAALERRQAARGARG